MAMGNQSLELPIILQWAIFYAERGFSIIPTAEGSKRPGLPWEEWAQKRPDTNQLTLWLTGLYRNSQIGMVTGRVSGNTFVVDADSGPGKEGAENLDDVLMMHDDFPETWTARSGGGGRHYFFRAPPGVRVKTGKDVLARHVDVRGEGGFLILPPSLHSSGRFYEWVQGVDPATTEIAAAPDWLLDMVRDRSEDILQPQLSPGAARDIYGGPPQLEMSRDATGDFTAFGRRIDGREEYMRDLLWARLIEEKRLSPLPIDAGTQERLLAECWAVYDRHVKARGTSLEGEGRGLKEMRRKLKYAVKKWDSKVALEATKPKMNGAWQDTASSFGGTPASEPAQPSAAPNAAGTASPPQIVTIEPAFPIDPLAIPPRPWLIPGLLIRNHVTVLVAPPGAGKSLLTLQIGLMLGAALPWAGWTPRIAARVLIVNSEDDLDEMRRRLVAASGIMGIDQETVREKLFLAKDPESIVIARVDPKNRLVMRTPLVEELVRLVKEMRIDCIVVDPFAETFEGDENSNSELKWAAILWREIARRTGAAVFLVHHTRKYATGMTGDMDAARGASALIGVARVVATMFAMTEEEAELFGVPVDERHRYVRFDDAKGTFSLVTGIARWFEKVARDIGNAGILPSDEVGVLNPWKPPGMFDGVSSETLNLALDIIDAGLLDDQSKPLGIPYSPYRRASKRWAGQVVCDTLGCTEERASSIVKKWLETGLLYEVDFEDNSKPRKGVKVDLGKRPGGPA